ncbi:unnamed protein product [Boreogadus saida]
MRTAAAQGTLCVRLRALELRVKACLRPTRQYTSLSPSYPSVHEPVSVLPYTSLSPSYPSVHEPVSVLPVSTRACLRPTRQYTSLSPSYPSVHEPVSVLPVMTLFSPTQSTQGSDLKDLLLVVTGVALDRVTG